MSGNGCRLSDDGVTVSRGLRVVSEVAKDIGYCIGATLREDSVLAKKRYLHGAEVDATVPMEASHLLA